MLIAASNRYLVTILTNQAGLNLHPDSDPKAKGPKNAAAAARDRVTAFKQKCGAILANLDIPLTIYAATGKDNFRKPRTGMWTELIRDHELEEGEVNLTESMFVGDAGGRIAAVKGATVVQKDFSCSDRNLASNIGMRYMTPEEFFLGEPARDFVRGFDLVKYPFGASNDVNLYQKNNKLDIVLFCGPPGAGKSTFYWNYLKPLGYERVNQDILKRLGLRD
jgi:bifunctional polynucleotide phosphatase/kinase